MNQLFPLITSWLVAVIVIGVAIFKWTPAPLKAKNEVSRAVSVVVRSAFLALVFAPYGTGPYIVVIAPASLFSISYALSDHPNRITDLKNCAQVFVIAWAVFAGLYGVQLIVRAIKNR
jgi:hypothetical protein